MSFSAPAPSPVPPSELPRLNASLLDALSLPREAGGIAGSAAGSAPTGTAGAGSPSRTGIVGRHPVDVPTYDRAALTGGIVHLGIGGFHRSHLARYVDELALGGHGCWSITGSGVMAHDGEMARLLRKQDMLYLLVERSGDDIAARIIGSITDVIPAHGDASALVARLVDESTRIVSLTVTESGYPVASGQFVPSADLEHDVGSAHPASTFGVITEALDQRRRLGRPPFTVLSCDNLPGNGTVARVAVLGTAELRSPDLARWLCDHGAFPNSMVDRITPQTTAADREWARETFGFVDVWPVVCEPFTQWALEDTFVDGRPKFERAGVLIADDVTIYEHMKLRLLNGSHSGLAYLAALAGIHFVHDAVANPSIGRFLTKFMSEEAAPNLAAPPGIDLVEYQRTLIERFSNPAIADTVGRLCKDGTSKFPTFIVPTVEDQLSSGGPIEMVSLILAGWCRYLRGVADDGSALVLAHDPGLADAVTAARASVHEPRAFLRLTGALGPHIQHSERLLHCFSGALDDLQQLGALRTVAKWTSVPADRASQ